MKNTMTQLYIVLGIIAFVVLMLLPSMLYSQTIKPQINRYIEYIEPINYVTGNDSLNNSLIGPDALYGVGNAEDAEIYAKEVAPLRKERFIRRIKMLFGVDISKHYDDKGHCYMNHMIAVFPETQLVKIRQLQIPSSRWYKPGRHSIVPSIIMHDRESDKKHTELSAEDKENLEVMIDRMYGDLYYGPLYPILLPEIINYCKWAYYNDPNAYETIRKRDSAILVDPGDDGPAALHRILDRHRYAAPYDCREGIPENTDINSYVLSFYAPIFFDADFIGCLNSIGRSRVYNNINETIYYHIPGNLSPDKAYKGEKDPVVVSKHLAKDCIDYVQKEHIDALRYESRLMGLLVRLYPNLLVEKSGSAMRDSILDFLYKHKAEFEKYDYFGYTLLRNLAKRRKIDNSKIGVPLSATADGSALMRIDPFESGVEFDTLRSGELFTVYEMGYDDFYLAQCAKPIEEWNKRDKDGYAMCTGRMEKVWCYVPKTDVQILSDADNKITPFIEWGIVSDADGYTNIWSKDDDKVVIDEVKSGDWVKILSYDMKSYLVELQDGRQGRIHKSRIIW
ncbi:MAG: hypothetical protein ACK5IQ_06330 [Bacteroidales bacterium]